MAHEAMHCRRTCNHRSATVAFAAAGLLVGSIHSAAAQPSERPSWLPTHDVAVIYRVSADMGSGVQKLQITYASGSDHIRLDYFRWIEAAYPFASMIVDRPANRLIGVQPERRRYVDRKLGGALIPGALPVPKDSVFSRIGTATIVGVICNDWRMRSEDKSVDRGTVCVTDDGVMLRLVQPGATQPAIIAVTVQRGAPPDGIFKPPADFQRVAPDETAAPPPPNVAAKRTPPPPIAKSSHAPIPGPAGAAAERPAKRPAAAAPEANNTIDLPPGWMLEGTPKQQ